MLAGVIREIDASLAASVPLPQALHDQTMELVAARIALLCARANPAFDSFRFYQAALGDARIRALTATVNSPRAAPKTRKPNVTNSVKFDHTRSA